MLWIGSYYKKTSQFKTVWRDDSVYTALNSKCQKGDDIIHQHVARKSMFSSITMKFGRMMQNGIPQDRILAVEKFTFKLELRERACIV